MRPLEQEDVPAVVELMNAHLLREALPGGDAAAFITSTTIADSWADPELPSLVATADDGSIVGFVASQPRKIWLDNEPGRAVCISHLVVAPSARTSNVGPQLLRQLLGGPQDLTYSDTATELVARLWRVLGGEVDVARRYDWLLVLNTARWASAVVRSGIRDRRIRREHLPVAGIPLQAAGRRLVARAYPSTPDGVVFVATDTAEFVTGADLAARRLRLRARYDSEYVDTVISRVALNGGEIVTGVVAKDDGQIVAAAVYELRHGAARVLSLLTSESGASAAIAALVDDARARGAAALTGRMEPVLADALEERMAVLGFARRPIVHTRRSEVRDALLQGSAIITRFDSEWWVP